MGDRAAQEEPGAIADSFAAALGMRAGIVANPLEVRQCASIVGSCHVWCCAFVGAHKPMSTRIESVSSVLRVVSLTSATWSMMPGGLLFEAGRDKRRNC